MTRYIITTGGKYIDIDAYASMIAYRELLRYKGYDSLSVSTAIPNESISPQIQTLSYQLDSYQKEKGDHYIVLDVSNPEMFDPIVDFSTLVSVIDHHTGFESYWKNRPQVKSQIEEIGSVCTLVAEKIIQQKAQNILTEDLSKLLIAGILDNTLNLKANITTNRDIDCYRYLLRVGNISASWGEKYFESCQQEIEAHLEKVLPESLKETKFTKTLPPLVGQLLVIDSLRILKRRSEIFKMMEHYKAEWLINIMDLKEGKSYLLAKNNQVIDNLEKLLKGSREENLLILNPFLLRKEIMQKCQKYEQKGTTPSLEI